MRMILMAALAAATLAGCGPEPKANAVAEQNAAANEALETDANGTYVGGSNFLDQMVALPDRDRNVVIVRAIMDSDKKCDGVLKSWREPRDLQGLPTYRAECRNGAEYRVLFRADGTAVVP